jgi:DHA2 family multidrug resistance protein
MFGAFLIPLSQSILFDAFPKEKRGQAMAMFGLGVVVAPVLGPTVGALLTDTYSWRMVFFVNLPIAGLALLMLAGELPQDDPEDVRIDWAGLILMALAIGALQFMLDQGESKDWRASRVIQLAAILSALATLAFLVRSLGRSENIVDLMSYTRAFDMLGWVAVALLPLLLVMRRPAHVGGAVPAH